MNPAFLRRTVQHTRTRAGILLCALVIALLSGCGQQGNSNTPFDIGAYQGKWVVINYWAEWCAPCKKEIPELNQLAEDYRDSLVVLGVNSDGVEGEKLAQQSQRMGIRFEVLPDNPADALRLARIAVLPTTYLFNPQGELAFKLEGAQTADQLLAKLQLGAGQHDEQKHAQP